MRNVKVPLETFKEYNKTMGVEVSDESDEEELLRFDEAFQNVWSNIQNIYKSFSLFLFFYD